MGSRSDFGSVPIGGRSNTTAFPPVSASKTGVYSSIHRGSSSTKEGGGGGVATKEGGGGGRSFQTFQHTNKGATSVNKKKMKSASSFNDSAKVDTEKTMTISSFAVFDRGEEDFFKIQKKQGKRCATMVLTNHLVIGLDVKLSMPLDEFLRTHLNGVDWSNLVRGFDYEFVYKNHDSLVAIPFEGDLQTVGDLFTKSHGGRGNQTYGVRFLHTSSSGRQVN